jgi:hypothetical protein
MDQILSFFPGQKVTVFLETKNSDGYRADSLTVPEITRIFGFNSSDGYTLYDGYIGTDGYHKPMTKIDTGLYYVNATLPRGASSVGCFLIDVKYTNPITSMTNTQTYQIVVTAPFGNFSTTIGN